MSQPDQIAVPINGFPGYLVSGEGIVTSRRIGGRSAGALGSTEHVLRPSPDKDGYPCVTLYTATGAAKRFRLGVLVLRAFVGPPQDGEVCCHRNGSKLDNSLANLRWDTQANNLADKKIHGTEMQGERHYLARLNEDAVRHIREAKASGVFDAKALAVRYGVSASAIYNVSLGRTWKHVAAASYAASVAA